MAWTASVNDQAREFVPVVFSEITEDDSDKTLAGTDYGGGRHLKITGVRIEYAASSDAGTRTPTLEIQSSGGDVLWARVLSSNSNVVADGSAVIECAPDLTSGSAVGGIVPESLPSELWLTNGSTLRVYDSAAVAASADDMVVHVRALRY